MQYGTLALSHSIRIFALFVFEPLGFGQQPFKRSKIVHKLKSVAIWEKCHIWHLSYWLVQNKWPKWRLMQKWFVFCILHRCKSSARFCKLTNSVDSIFQRPFEVHLYIHLVSAHGRAVQIGENITPLHPAPKHNGNWKCAHDLFQVLCLDPTGSNGNKKSNTALWNMMQKERKIYFTRCRKSAGQMRWTCTPHNYIRRTELSSSMRPDWLLLFSVQNLNSLVWQRCHKYI